MARLHELKCDCRPFTDLRSGRKTCEVRQNDRLYEVDDILHLREGIRSANGYTYTGRETRRIVTHVQSGYGLPDGMVVLSTRELDTDEKPFAWFRRRSDGGLEGPFFDSDSRICDTRRSFWSPLFTRPQPSGQPIYQYRHRNETELWMDCEADEYETFGQWPEIERRIVSSPSNGAANACAISAEEAAGPAALNPAFSAGDSHMLVTDEAAAGISGHGNACAYRETCRALLPRHGFEALPEGLFDQLLGAAAVRDQALEEAAALCEERGAAECARMLRERLSG